eukprot:gene9929-2250_t
MSVFGVSGFYNAPISKILFFLIIGFNILSTAISTNKKGGGPELFGYGTPNLNILQFYRLITGFFMFNSVGELFFGIILLYCFRLFERNYGSQKFLIFSIISTILTYFFQFTIVVITPHFNTIWSGAYGIIFSCLVSYILDVPATESYKVWKFNISEKYAIYLLSIQLSIAHFPNSTIAAISGILAGFIYRLDFLRLKEIRFPKVFIQFGNYIYPYINTPNQAMSLFAQPTPMNIREQNSTPQRLRNPVQQQNNERQTNVNLDDENVSAREDYVQLLIEMGFSREDSIQALISTNNDLQRATEVLIY